MKKYDVYFEIFGKKMKASVAAKSEEDAKAAIKEKIIFHKVHEDVFDTDSKDLKEAFDAIKNFLNIK